MLYFKKMLADRTSKSSIANLVMKPISLILGLVYTPMLLNYLGDERYGLWATILSVTNWINYCDIGIGHGLRNMLTLQLTQKKYDIARKLISTAYICMTFISLAIFIGIIIFSQFVDWSVVFSTTIPMTDPVNISFAFICINFVLGLANSVLYALQKSELISIRNILAQIINIIGIWVLSKTGKGDLVSVSILFGSSTMLTYLINSISMLRHYNFCRISAKSFDVQYIKEISNTGIKFFIIQIAVVFMYTVDNILISRLFGAAEVTPYSIINRIYTVVYGFYTAIAIPIWSASTEAVAKKNFQWFENASKKMNCITILFSSLYIILGLVFTPVARIWLRRDMVFPDELIIVVALYTILQTIQNPYSQFNNGIGALNGQLILGIIQGGLNIPLSIFLAKQCGLGVTGIKLATTILMSISVVFQPLYFRYSLKQIRSNLMEG